MAENINESSSTLDSVAVRAEDISTARNTTPMEIAESLAPENKIEPTSNANDNREQRESSHAEQSPQGRYVKLDERLGSGAYKDVWRSYDTTEGMEVAWNVVKLNRIPPGERKRIKIEVKLLKDLDHKNVIKYYNSWVDREKEQIVFITEIMSAGSLKDYLRKNHHMIRWHAVKRWCKQILSGLEYLHEKRCIHRDIKCDNIFINGTTGDIRIGDLGLSTKIAEARGAIQGGMNFEGREYTSQVMTCLGTPEFMAPELYEENYDEKVDIYAFGMTVLEMVTASTPYQDCTSAPQIYKKVMKGELPPELNKVNNSNAQGFIELCLKSKEGRPSATELLKHPFLSANAEEDFKEVNEWNTSKSRSHENLIPDDEDNLVGDLVGHDDDTEEGGGIVRGSSRDQSDDEDGSSRPRSGLSDDKEGIVRRGRPDTPEGPEIKEAKLMKRVAQAGISSKCDNNAPFSDIQCSDHIPRIAELTNSEQKGKSSHMLSNSHNDNNQKIAERQGIKADQMTGENVRPDLSSYSQTSIYQISDDGTFSSAITPHGSAYSEDAPALQLTPPKLSSLEPRLSGEIRQSRVRKVRAASDMSVGVSSSSWQSYSTGSDALTMMLRDSSLVDREDSPVLGYNSGSDVCQRPSPVGMGHALPEVQSLQSAQDVDLELEQCNSFPVSALSASASGVNQNSAGGTESPKLRDPQGECDAVVINLEDHAENSDSLIFLLRLQNSSRDLTEVEFEFNLTTDNALTLIDDMKDDADIASLSIPPDVMLSAIRPIVELAKQVAMDIMKSKASKNHSTSMDKGLSSAVLEALLRRIGTIKPGSSVSSQPGVEAFSKTFFEISDNISEIANEMGASVKSLMSLQTAACRRFNYEIVPVTSTTKDPNTQPLNIQEPLVPPANIYLPTSEATCLEPSAAHERPANHPQIQHAYSEHRNQGAIMYENLQAQLYLQPQLPQPHMQPTLVPQAGHGHILAGHSAQYADAIAGPNPGLSIGPALMGTVPTHPSPYYLNHTSIQGPYRPTGTYKGHGTVSVPIDANALNGSLGVVGPASQSYISRPGVIGNIGGGGIVPPLGMPSLSTFVPTFLTVEGGPNNLMYSPSFVNFASGGDGSLSAALSLPPINNSFEDQFSGHIGNSNSSFISKNHSIDVNGLTNVLDDDFSDDFSDDDFELDENDEVYSEILNRYRESVQKAEKDKKLKLDQCISKWKGEEEKYKKDYEKLKARKDDLDRQLVSMEDKFKERMDELAAKIDSLTSYPPSSSSSSSSSALFPAVGSSVGVVATAEIDVTVVPISSGPTTAGAQNVVTVNAIEASNTSLADTGGNVSRTSKTNITDPITVTTKNLSPSSALISPLPVTAIAADTDRNVEAMANHTSIK